MTSSTIMSLTVLRVCMRNFCVRRSYFLTARTLSSRPVTESNNLPLLKRDDEKGPSDLEPASEEATFDSLASRVHHNLKASDALSILKKLRKISVRGDVKYDTFINDPRFDQICHTLQTACERLRFEQVVTGLRCLLELGLPPDMQVVKVFENEVLWTCRKMSVKTLSICLDFHTRFQETDQQKRVVQEIVSHIKNRWVEIENSVEVIAIIRNRNMFGEPFVAKIEDKMLEFADKISFQELLLMFTAFSQQKYRPSPVLRALSYYLVQKQENLTLPQCCDLCFALNSLNFIDGNILNKITEDALLGLESNESAPLVFSLMTSLSLLRWDHSVLLERCCEWVENFSDKLRKRDWVCLVLSLANLNYQPENETLLFSLVMKALKPVETELPPSTWLDVIWALAVLGKATQQHLASVLEPSFYETLISDDIPNSVINKLKLQNIAAVARVEFPLARIPSPSLQKFQLPVSVVDQKLKLSVVEALNTFLPPNYLATDLNTNLGFMITGEFIVDADSKPVSILDYGIKAGTNKELKILPQGYRRIALLVWGFKDMTAKTSSISGMNSLSVRLLTKLGYTVVEVPYFEYQALKTTVQQVMYIQQKIKDRVLKM